MIEVIEIKRQLQKITMASKWQNINLGKLKQGSTMYTPKIKHMSRHVQIINNLGRTGRVASVDAVKQKRHSVACPEGSIQQIKCKIKQFLTNISETSALHNYNSEPQTPTANKSIKEQFRISFMKKNQRKKANLKLLDSLAPERYMKLGSEVNISEMHINQRQSVQRKTQESFIRRKHRNRISELKSNYEKRQLMESRKNKVPALRFQELLINGKRQDNAGGWDSMMDPWWDDDNMDLPTA